MLTYEKFFTNEAITKVLCQQRIAFCQKAHEREFFDRIHQKKQLNEKPEILKLMPPRSEWKRSRFKWRKGISSPDLNLRDLNFTVEQFRKAPSPRHQTWIDKQNKLIELIREKAFSDTVLIDTPELIPVPKKDTSENRLIASYSNNLADSILLKQCANYLRKKFDHYFLDCSFAFRSPSQGKPKTHHDAFEALVNFWKHNQKNNQIHAYVAECDIQGFFDTIDHKIILKCYDDAVDELEKSGIEIDRQSRKIICAYLDSYSYNQSHADLKISNSSINLKNRNETLEKYLYPNIKYGVPQGGALSVFFANLLLHKADIVLTNILKTSSSNAKYIRYCDDMVIITLDEKLTNQAFDAYIKELGELHLIHHKLKPTDNYSKEFWDSKTKKYIWSNTAMPWLAFVGYHLRYDGMARIRPSSLKKELEKQNETQEKFLSKIKRAKKTKTLKLSKKQLIVSLEGRLRAGSIGKRADKDLSCGMGISDFGWCKGFEGLISENLPKPQTIAWTQLRHLDRGLKKQLRVAKHKLNKYSFTQKLKFEDEDDDDDFKLKYLGKPRSYAGQIERDI